MEVPEVDSVTLEIQCWQADYEKVLDYDKLLGTLEKLNYQFFGMRILCNYVRSRKKVKELVEDLHQKGLHFDLVFSEDVFPQALEFFQLPLNSFGDGIEYSRSQFTGLFVNESKYVFHLNADITIDNPKMISFIPEMVDVLNMEPSFLSAGLSWSYSTGRELFGQEGAKLESVGRYLNYLVCNNFSDNCYLVDVEKLRKINFETFHEETRAFPTYAGNSFEKRVASYGWNHEKFRLIHPDVFTVELKEISRQSLFTRIKVRFSEV
jgi:hypothetical protein